MRCKVRKSCGGSMIRLSCVMQGNFSFGKKEIIIKKVSYEKNKKTNYG